VDFELALVLNESPETREVTEQEKLFLELRQEVDLLRREIRHSRAKVDSPSDAGRLLHELRTYGLPTSEIREILLRSGVPSYWVSDALGPERQASLFESVSDLEVELSEDPDGDSANQVVRADS
jgi:hypothetical protein